MQRRTLLSLSLLGLVPPACAQTMTDTAAPPPTAVVHPAWSRNASIYEVNLRQYSNEGSFAAFEADLPRLKKMGVDILWLMPIHPIGEKNRKGGLGSYYAVRDYTGVNPEFGTLPDLKRLVASAHALQMKVIIDWVANHTAWDHPWTTQHPGWYKKNEKGEIFPVTFKGDDGKVEEWSDVVALDYTQKPLWRAMIDAMAFWVREAGIDGFRCDVASLVPTPFWEQARAELDRIKPVFMLAESDAPELLHKAFDMVYDWRLYELMKALAKGQGDAGSVRAYLEQQAKAYPADAYRMLFTSNHDINSWHGHDAELYGPAFKLMAVLAATLPGMPLVYSGQESMFDKRLQFFEKDPIAWKQRDNEALYTQLLQLKHEHPALWNGTAGAPVELLPLPNRQVLAFERRKQGDRVTVVANLSAKPQSVRLPGQAADEMLPPWGWRIDTGR